jgi:hypothetical protein
VQTRIYMKLRPDLVRILGAYQRGLWPLLTLCLRAARKRVLLLTGTRPEKLGIRPMIFDDAEQFLRFQQFGDILANYRPKPYQGNVILLRPKSVRNIYPTDWTAGWGKVAPNLEVHELPGDHETCRTEHLGDVAEHITRCFRDFHAETQGAVVQRQSR